MKSARQRKLTRKEAQLAQALERATSDNHKLNTRILDLEGALREESAKRERQARGYGELTTYLNRWVVELKSELAAERSKSLWRRIRGWLRGEVRI